MSKSEIFEALGETFTRDEARRQIEIERESIRRMLAMGELKRHHQIIALGITERIALLKQLAE